MGSIAESDRCSIARTRNRTVAILFNQKTACRTMFGRATSRATVALEFGTNGQKVEGAAEVHVLYPLKHYQKVHELNVFIQSHALVLPALINRAANIKMREKPYVAIKKACVSIHDAIGKCICLTPN